MTGIPPVRDPLPESVTTDPRNPAGLIPLAAQPTPLVPAVTPAREAGEALELARRSGLPADLVARDATAVRRGLRGEQIRMADQSVAPILMQNMRTNALRQALFEPELEKMSTLERQLTAIRLARTRATFIENMQPLVERVMFSPDATQADRDRLVGMEDFAKRIPVVRDDLGFMGTLPSELAGQLPQMAESVLESLALSGAAAGTVGAVVGGATLLATRNPQAAGTAASTAMRTAGGVGFKVGMQVAAGRRIMAQSYLQIRGTKDPVTGRLIDNETAVGISMMVGLAGGMAEGISVGAAMKWVPFLRALNRNGASQLLQATTRGGAFRQFVRNIGSQAIAEGSTEWIQQWMQEAGRAIGEAAERGEFDAYAPGESMEEVFSNRFMSSLLGTEIPDDMDFGKDPFGVTRLIATSPTMRGANEAFRLGAALGGTFGIAGGSVNLATDLARVNRDLEFAGELDKAMANISSLEALQAAPNEVRAVIEEMTGDEIFYDPAEFVAFWQSQIDPVTEQPVDPATIVGELGGDVEAFRVAVEQNQPFALPTSQVLTKLAKDERFREFAVDNAMETPTSTSRGQARKQAKATRVLMDSIVEQGKALEGDASVPATVEGLTLEIRGGASKALQELGLKPAEADANAEIMGNLFRALVVRYKMPLSQAREIASNTSIIGEGMGAFLPIIQHAIDTAGPMPVVQGPVQAPRAPEFIEPAPPAEATPEEVQAYRDRRMAAERMRDLENARTADASGPRGVARDKRGRLVPRLATASNLNLARAWVEQREATATIEAEFEALAESPEGFEALDLARFGDMEDAIGLLDSRLKDGADQIPVLFKLGKDWERARADFKRLDEEVKLRGMDPDAYLAERERLAEVYDPNEQGGDDSFDFEMDEPSFMQAAVLWRANPMLHAFAGDNSLLPARERVGLWMAKMREAYREQVKELPLDKQAELLATTRQWAAMGEFGLTPSLPDIDPETATPEDLALRRLLTAERSMGLQAKALLATLGAKGVAMEQRMFHGGPYAFWQFLFSKKGGGSGGAMFGYGTYLADVIRVAMNYRRETAHSFTVDGMSRRERRGFSIDEEEAFNKLELFRGDIDAMLERAADPATRNWTTGVLDRNNEWNTLYADIIRRFRDEGRIQQGAGYLYTVDVAPEAVATFIDADRPAAGQPVLEAARKIGVLKVDELTTGRHAYIAIASRLQNAINKANNTSDGSVGVLYEYADRVGIELNSDPGMITTEDLERWEAQFRAKRDQFKIKDWARILAFLYDDGERAASTLLAEEFGIKGMAYLDEQSRNNGEDWYLAEIWTEESEADGKPFTFSRFRTAAERDKWVASFERSREFGNAFNGVMPSKMATARVVPVDKPATYEGTRNYVVYDNSVINVLLRNGELAPWIEERAAKEGNEVITRAVANYHETPNARSLNMRVKAGEQEAIVEMARQMAFAVPEDAVLVPVVSSKGRATDALAIAQEIGRLKGLPVADILRGKERMSSHLAKRAKTRVSLEDLEMTVEGDIPTGRLVLIDNVVTTGRTIDAARAALGGEAMAVVHSVAVRQPLSPGDVTNRRVVFLQRMQEGQGEKLAGVAIRRKADGEVRSMLGFDGGHDAIDVWEGTDRVTDEEVTLEYGFITSTGRFLNRVDAMEFLRATNPQRAEAIIDVISEDGPDTTDLRAEDFVMSEGIGEGGIPFQQSLPGLEPLRWPGLPADDPAQTLPAGFKSATITQLDDDGEIKVYGGKIRSIDELVRKAQPMANRTTERFDIYVTDAEGTLLGVVGGLRGIINSALAGPGLFVMDALRIPGAAVVYAVHNHPSGRGIFSSDDIRIHAHLQGMIKGTQLQWGGAAAIGARFTKGGTMEAAIERPGEIAGAWTKPYPVQAPLKKERIKKVKILTRTYREHEVLGLAVTGPRLLIAWQAANLGPADGILFMDSQHYPIGFLPITEVQAQTLRGTGQFEAVALAAGMSNAASAALIADSLTMSAAGNLMGALGAMDIPTHDVIQNGRSLAEQGRMPGTGGVAFRQAAPKGFYSALERFIEGAKQETQTGKGWLDWINANAAKNGVKQDELEYSGLPEALELAPRDRFTKADLLRIKRDDGVDVAIEQSTSRMDLMNDRAFRDSFDGFLETIEDEARTYYLNVTGGYDVRQTEEGFEVDGVEVEPGRWQVIDGQGNHIEWVRDESHGYEVMQEYQDNDFEEWLTDNNRDLRAEAFEMAREDMVDLRGTKHERYQLPGGRDYKELVAELRHSDNRNFYETTESHFAVANEDTETVLGWMRVNVRDNVFIRLPDPDGIERAIDRVLFLEEMQSDWAQAGRKHGFREKLSPRQEREAKLIGDQMDVVTENIRREFEDLTSFVMYRGDPGADPDPREAPTVFERAVIPFGLYAMPTRRDVAYNAYRVAVARLLAAGERTPALEHAHRTWNMMDEGALFYTDKEKAGRDLILTLARENAEQDGPESVAGAIDRLLEITDPNAGGRAAVKWLATHTLPDRLLDSVRTLAGMYYEQDQLNTSLMEAQSTPKGRLRTAAQRAMHEANAARDAAKAEFRDRTRESHKWLRIYKPVGKSRDWGETNVPTFVFTAWALRQGDITDDHPLARVFHSERGFGWLDDVYYGLANGADYDTLEEGVDLATSDARRIAVQDDPMAAEHARKVEREGGDFYAQMRALVLEPANDYPAFLEWAKAETAWAESRERYNAAVAALGDVEPGPFVKDTEAWVSFMLKRAIRYALDNNLEAVTWTTGQEQSQRWGKALQEAVEYIDWERVSDTRVKISARQRYGGRTIDKELDRAGLADHAGSDIADQIFGSPDKKGRVQGNDLKMGMNGFISFYGDGDKKPGILGTIANKVLKKLGGDRLVPMAFDLPNTGLVNRVGFLITPEMKARALEPMPLYKRTPRGEMGFRGQFFRTTDGRRVIQLTGARDRTTFLHELSHFFKDVLEDLEAEGNAQAGVDLETIRAWQAKAWEMIRKHARDHIENAARYYGAVPPEVEEAFARRLEAMPEAEVVAAIRIPGKDSAQVADPVLLAIRLATEEYWANGWQKWVMSGEAPSLDLKRAFVRFRGWLKEAVGDPNAADVQLSDEVRELMKRLVASEDAIVMAEQDLKRAPLPMMGMPPKTQEKYLVLLAEAHQAAVERLQAETLKDAERLRTKEAEARRAQIAEEEQEAMDEDPAYRARAILTTGSMPDGTAVAEGSDILRKLDRRATLALVGPDVVRRLPRFVFKLGGLNPQLAADALGFPTGAALLEALAGTQSPKVELEARVTRRMEAEFPTLMEPTKLNEAAIVALHNASQEKLLKFEAQWLRENAGAAVLGATKEAGKLRVMSSQAILEMAEGYIRERPIAQITPLIFRRAEVSAHNESIRLAAKGDFDGAARAKERERVAHAMWTVATEFKAKLPKLQKQLAQAFKSDKRIAETRHLPLVYGMRALLASHGMGQAKRTASQYLAQIAEYAPKDAVEIEGLLATVSVPLGLPFKEMTVGQFMEIHGVAMAIWEKALRVEQFTTAEGKVALEEVLRPLIDALEGMEPQMGEAGRLTSYGWKDKATSVLLSAQSMMRRVLPWINAMDLNDFDGPFHRVFRHPIFSVTPKYRAALEASNQRLLELATAMGELPNQPIPAPELGVLRFDGKRSHFQWRNHAHLLGGLLHAGNVGNLTKNLEGRGWNQGDWQAMLDRYYKEGILRKAHIDFIQGVWDLFEEMKPDLWRAAFELRGYWPGEVEALPFKTPWGTYRGGYAPALRDPDVPSGAKQESLARDIAAAFEEEHGFSFPAQVASGMTQERTEAVAPLWMDYRLIQKHIADTQKFIHLANPIREISRVVMNKEFQSAINRVNPQWLPVMLMPWIEATAAQRVEMPVAKWLNPFAKFAKVVRSRASLSLMVANVPNTLEQITGISIAKVRIPAGTVRRAHMRFLASPKEVSKAMADKSEFMRQNTSTRMMDMGREFEAILLSPTAWEKGEAALQKHGYILQRMTQGYVNAIVWTAGYDHAIGQGMTENQAIEYADDQIRLTQGDFAPESMSTIERGNAFARLFTTFTGYFNMLSNLNVTEYQVTMEELGLKKGMGRLLYVYWYGWFVPMVGSRIIRNAFIGGATTAGALAFGQDDEEDGYLDEVVETVVGSQVSGLTASVPIVGAAVQRGIINRFNDNAFDDQLNLSPAISLLEEASKGAFAAGNIMWAGYFDEEIKKRKVLDAFALLTLLGVPTAAPRRATGYLMDVQAGNVEPTGPIDMTRGILRGR